MYQTFVRILMEHESIKPSTPTKALLTRMNRHPTAESAIRELLSQAEDSDLHEEVEAFVTTMGSGLTDPSPAMAALLIEGKTMVAAIQSIRAARASLSRATTTLQRTVEAFQLRNGGEA